MMSSLFLVIFTFAIVVITGSYSSLHHSGEGYNRRFEGPYRPLNMIPVRRTFRHNYLRNSRFPRQASLHGHGNRMREQDGYLHGMMKVPPAEEFFHHQVSAYAAPPHIYFQPPYVPSNPDTETSLPHQRKTKLRPKRSTSLAESGTQLLSNVKSLVKTLIDTSDNTKSENKINTVVQTGELKVENDEIVENKTDFQQGLLRKPIEVEEEEEEEWFNEPDVKLNGERVKLHHDPRTEAETDDDLYSTGNENEVDPRSQKNRQNVLVKYVTSSFMLLNNNGSLQWIPTP